MFQRGEGSNNASVALAGDFDPVRVFHFFMDLPVETRWCRIISSTSEDRS
jgi:hypothetical protein